MALQQFTFEFRKGDSHLLDKHKQMVDKVAGFICKSVAVAVNGFYNRLHSLFSNFWAIFFTPFMKRRVV